MGEYPGGRLGGLDSPAEARHRKYNALPLVIDHNRRAATESIGPFSLASTNIAVSSGDKGCNSNRSR